jgi:predicted ATPase
LDVVDPRGLTPLVGRQVEIALLLERWAQVSEGFGHVVVLSGEAGIVKSRLAQVLQAHPAEESLTRLECRCSPYHQQSAWYPMVELFYQILQWQQDDTPDLKLQKLETVLTQCALPLEEAVPLLAALLSLPGTDIRYPPRSLTPQQWRHKTLQAILAVVLGLAARYPVLVIVEDLHWVDPSTLEVLTLLVEQTPTVPLCLVVTCRPTFQVPWGVRSYLTQITLQRLPRAQVEQIVTSLTGGKALPPEVLRLVVARADGVPLFVEELTKAVLETGMLRDAADHYEVTAPLPTLAIPTTLHDSLMARLDRLGPAKSVAQLGAVLGRRFPYAWLRAVAQQDDASLQRELEQLVEADLVYQQGFPPQATYVFKHALVQEAAYQSLMRHTRRHSHQRIAQVLAEQFPEIAETQPELLAHHYTEAGLPAQALPYWQQAGQRAVERSANVEAVSHLRRGLEALQSLPATPEHIQYELALLVTLGPPLLITKGNTAPEVEQVYTRAQQICQQMGESSQIFSVLVGLWRFYLNRARLWTARDLAEQGCTVARRLHDPMLLQEAHVMLGSTLFFLGETVSAREHLERGMALYAPRLGRSQAFNSGIDPGVMGLARAAWTLWMLGYPNQALTRVYEALTLAQQLSHASSLAFASHYTAVLHQSRREAQLAQERAEATMALGREQGFAQWLVGGMFVQGWALAEQGLTEDGIAQLRQALATWQAMGTELARTHIFVRLAEAYKRGGHTAEGLRVLAEALSAVHDNAERYYEAEVHRLKGELLLQSGVRELESGVWGLGYTIHYAYMDEAETCFRQAIDVARHQQAKSLELRAVLSLSRLWQAQDRHTEARSMLEEIYGWFTEGFETQDLQEAKTLLEALA